MADRQLPGWAWVPPLPPARTLDDRIKAADDLAKWIRDLDVILADRRGRQLGAEPATFNLEDQRDLLKRAWQLITGEQWR